MKTIYKEIISNLLYIVAILAVILLTDISQEATWKTIVFVLLFICLFWLAILLIKNHLFPNIDFEKELKSDNISIGLVMLGLCLGVAIVIGLCTLSLYWSFTDSTSAKELQTIFQGLPK